MTDPAIEPEAKSTAKSKSPTRAEIVLAAIASAAVIGWVFGWLNPDPEREIRLFFRGWCAILSFAGALAVVVYVALKALRLVSLPESVDSRVVPILSLIPVTGYLISILFPLYAFLIVGGSIALAYVSASTYWRQQLEFARQTIAGGEQKKPETEEEPPATPGENEGGSPPGEPASPGS